MVGPPIDSRRISRDAQGGVTEMPDHDRAHQAGRCHSLQPCGEIGRAGLPIIKTADGTRE
jgi:hypothetical protein